MIGKRGRIGGEGTARLDEFARVIEEEVAEVLHDGVGVNRVNEIGIRKRAGGVLRAGEEIGNAREARMADRADPKGTIDAKRCIIKEGAI